MNEAKEAAKIEAGRKSILMKILSKDAYERLSRVKISNPAVAVQLEMYLIQVYQTGQLTDSISDEKLKQILNVLVGQKKETKIKKKKK